MHILFIINDYPPGGLIGGIVTYTQLMAQAWHAAGHQVSVICQSRDQKRHDENQEGIRVIRIPSKKYPLEWWDQIKFRCFGDNSLRLIYHKEFSWAICQEVKSWNDLPVVIESPDAFGWSWALQKYLNIPVMIRVHGPNKLASSVDPDNQHLKAHAVNEQEEWCLTYAKGIFPPTNYLSEYVHKLKINFDPAKREVIKYPFELPQIPGVSRYKKPTILTVGRLIPGKGFETAIQVLPHLDPEWRLHIVGPDDKFGHQQKSYQAHLENLAHSLNVGERVKFLGQLDKKSVYEEFKKSHVFMLDSKNDNMPFVVLESLSLNIPVVASRIGGIPETLNEQGQLIDVGDVQGYVRAIKLIDLEKNTNTREVVQNNHGTSNIQKQLEEAYRELIC